MEGRKSNESQMKKTEDKDTSSSQCQSGFHKNSNELVNSCVAEDRKNSLESFGNGDADYLVEAHHPANAANLVDQRNDELLRLLTGEQRSESVNFDQMAAEGIGWWTRRLDKMNREEFQQFYAALGILRERMQTHLQQRVRITDSNSAQTSSSSSNTSTNGSARRKRR
ncbi:hypothetical protein SLEP1_g6238 [Rubroshorea leprosula]|uniref:Uncharacterized protein n=1 Tax=Rubroshorea leprosula TaxID=152421 RepID=A0AAV5I0H8_9ROSI|nr:hypothetical protein SLEP1_g6238 [Rubroshorea leprosula]